MPKLIAEGGHALEIPILPCRIGTAKANEVPISEGFGVAEHHLTIAQQAGQFFIQDSGSGLGTLVNGQPINESRLSSGDRLQIGKLSLTFSCPSAVPEAPSPQSSSTFGPGGLPPSERSTTQFTSTQVIPPGSLAAQLAAAAHTAASTQPAASTNNAPLPDSTLEAPKVAGMAVKPITNATEPAPSSLPAASAGSAETLPKTTEGSMGPAIRESSIKPLPGGLGKDLRQQKGKAKIKSRKAGLGSAKATNKRSMLKPVLLGGLVAMIAAGGFVLWKGEAYMDELKHRFGLADVASPRLPLVAHARAPTNAGILDRLANAARPGMIVCADLATGLASLEEEHTSLVNGLTGLLGRVTTLGVDACSKVTFLGGGLDDAVIALQFRQALGKSAIASSIESLALRPTDDAGSSFHQDLFGWPVMVAALNDSTLVVGAPGTIQRLLASNDKKVSKVLGKNLHAKLMDAKAPLVVHMDAALLDRKALPETLRKTLSPDIKTLSTTLEFGTNATWSSKLSFSSAARAEHFEDNLPLLFQGLLAPFLESSTPSEQQRLLATLSSSVQDDVVTAKWSTNFSELAGISRQAMTKMQAALALDTGPPTAEELDRAEREASRVVAMYQTAKDAGAALDEVTDVASALAILQEGVAGTDAKWANHTFKVRRYGSRERRQIEDLLEYHQGDLIVGASEVKMNAIRNAEGLASVYAAAQAAGAKVEEANDLNAVLDLLTDGDGLPGTGSFSEESFSYPLSKADTEAAARYLSFENGQIIFQSEVAMTVPGQGPAHASLKPQRDASSLASVYTAAKQTGAKEWKEVNTLDEALDRLTSPEGKAYSLPLSAEETAAARAFLKFEENALVYQELDGE